MSRKRRLLLILVPVTVAFLILVTTVMPFPEVLREHDFWIGIGANFGCGMIDTTPWTPIAFDWSAKSSTNFSVWHCVVSQSGGGTSYTWTAVYQSSGTGGSGQISSQGGWYLFGTLCGPLHCIPTNLSVSYFGPLVDLWTPSGYPPITLWLH